MKFPAVLDTMNKRCYDLLPAKTVHYINGYCLSSPVNPFDPPWYPDTGWDLLVDFSDPKQLTISQQTDVEISNCQLKTLSTDAYLLAGINGAKYGNYVAVALKLNNVPENGDIMRLNVHIRYYPTSDYTTEYMLYIITVTNGSLCMQFKSSAAVSNTCSNVIGNASDYVGKWLVFLFEYLCCYTPESSFSPTLQPATATIATTSFLCDQYGNLLSSNNYLCNIITITDVITGALIELYGNGLPVIDWIGFNYSVGGVYCSSLGSGGSIISGSQSSSASFSG